MVLKGKARLIKLREAPNPVHPNNIEVGEERFGFVHEWPKRGERFNLYHSNGKIGTVFSTSVVTGLHTVVPGKIPGGEIGMGEVTFETLNSVYYLKMIDNDPPHEDHPGGLGESVPVGPRIPPKSGRRGEAIPGVSKADILAIILDNLGKAKEKR